MTTKTFNTGSIVKTRMQLDNIALPTGMGVGAIRHSAAIIVLDHWDILTTEGVPALVDKYTDEILCAASDPDDLLDANDDRELPVDVQDALARYLAAWRGTAYGRRPDAVYYDAPTPGRIDAFLANHLVGSLAKWVAEHIRRSIIADTGIDPDTDLAALADWNAE